MRRGERTELCYFKRAQPALFNLGRFGHGSTLTGHCRPYSVGQGISILNTPQKNVIQLVVQTQKFDTRSKESMQRGGTEYTQTNNTSNIAWLTSTAEQCHLPAPSPKVTVWDSLALVEKELAEMRKRWSNRWSNKIRIFDLK